MSPTIDWPALTREIADAAAAMFSKLRQSHPDEVFYAFALYTDSGAMTVVPAANSQAHLEKTLSEDEDIDPRSRAYYTWASAEWGYEAWGGEAFDGICRCLRAALETIEDDEAFAGFERHLHRAMIDALALADQAGVFGTGPTREALTLFITISDDDRAVDIETAASATLNPAPVHARFAGRYAVS